MILAGTGVAAGVSAFLGVFVWVIRSIIDHRRWLRLSRVQAEVHTKLLDRLTTNEDLLSYIQSPAGRRFLESAPITMDSEPRATTAPISRIIWSLQAGLVLAALGQRVLVRPAERLARGGGGVLHHRRAGGVAGSRIHGVGGAGLRRLDAAGPGAAAEEHGSVRSGMREFALTEMERAGAFEDAERTFQMTEEAFRVFYEQTARPVWVYLARTTGDDRLADDLLQETYYRFLRSRPAFESDDHRRHYLFRIATNLVRDQWRRARTDAVDLGEAVGRS